MLFVDWDWVSNLAEIVRMGDGIDFCMNFMCIGGVLCIGGVGGASRILGLDLVWHLHLHSSDAFFSLSWT